MMEDLAGRIPTIGQAFVSGLLSFLTPCILPLLPVALVYVTGVSLERRRAAAPGEKALPAWRLEASLLAHLGSFLGGFILVLLGLAAGHTWVGRLLLSGQRVFMVLGGILVAVMGVFMTGLVPRADRGDLRLRLRHRLPGYAASVAVGATYGFVWSPCVGPTLGTLILLAGQAETSDVGMPLLIIHGLGFGLPFVLTGVLFEGLLQRVRGPRAVLVLEKGAGALLTGVGFLIAVGKFLSVTELLFEACDGWVQALIQGGL
jgi:cytochrome c-type biogenesis protein